MIHTKKNANGYLQLHSGRFIKIKFRALKIIILLIKKVCALFSIFH